MIARAPAGGHVGRRIRFVGREQTIIGVDIPQIDARYVTAAELCEPVFDSARGCSRLPAAISAACPQ
jgi:hypothetical protein